MNINNIIQLQAFLKFLDTLQKENILAYNLNFEKKIILEEQIEEIKEKIIELDNDIDKNLADIIEIQTKKMLLKIELKYFNNKLIELKEKEENINNYRIATLNKINDNI